METHNKRGSAPNARNDPVKPSRGGSASTQAPDFTGGGSVKRPARETVVLDDCQHEFYRDGTAESEGFPFYIVKDPENGRLPRKLGDGTFGMVFEARSIGGDKEYALKVLYGGVSAPAAHDRELRMALTVQENLAKLDEERRTALERDDADDPTNRLVLPIAYCKAFENLWGHCELAKQGVEFSTNAYIMKKFDHSLKDLLEDPERLITGVDQKELERSAMPIVAQVARGLHTLHAADLRHQDIKPANIYYKPSENRIDFKLGDLGCVVPHEQPLFWGTRLETTTLEGFGTRHYRSIEQVDYWDCAECRVTVKSKDRIELETRDPKFEHTIIEEGDLARFAKSKDHALFEVEKVTHPASGGKVTIVLKRRVLDECVDITDDRKTQVLFYKNPSTKTDLFGLGGILYEIVTAGQSPEHFYKLLYTKDRESIDIEENILSRYESWQNRMLDDPQIGAIFMEINRGSDDRLRLVHEEIVGIVLKCMMCNAKGSYYESLKFANDEITAWSKLIRIFDAIIDRRYMEHAVNVLTRDEILETDKALDDASGSAEQSSAKISVDQFFRDIRSTDGRRDSRHWIETGAFLRILVNALPTQVSSGSGCEAQASGGVSKMVLLAPDLLTLNVDKRRISPRRTVSLDGDLSRAILAQDPSFTRIRRFATQFEPIWWQYGACRVEFEFEDEKEQETASPPSVGEHREARASAQRGQGGGGQGGMLGNPSGTAEGSAPGCDGGGGDYRTAVHSRSLSIIRPLEFGFSMARGEAGDFVLSVGTLHPQLYRIIDVVEASEGKARNGAAWQHMRVCQEQEPDVPESAGSDGSREPKDGYLIKRPEPSEYYAGTLGAYIYQFLVRGSDGIVDFPHRIHAHIRNGTSCSCFGTVTAMQWKALGKGDWPKLKRYTLQLIMWLSLGGGFGNRPRRWGDIRAAIRDWIKAIEEVSGASTEDWNFAQRKDADTRPLDGTTSGGEASISSAEWEATVGVCPRRWRGWIGRS